MNDLLALKTMDSKDGMTPYEQYMMGYKQQKSHTSGVGITGLVLGTVGTALAIGAWVFAPTYGNAKAHQAREAANAARDIANAQYTAALQLMNQQNQNTNATLDRLISTVATERAERIAGDVTLTNTVNDSVSGQQASTLTAQQAAELSAVNSVMQQTYSDFVTGRASLNPTPVSLYSAPAPCGCPATNCGCNG